MPSKPTLLFLLIAVVACEREPARRDPMQVGSGRAAEAHAVASTPSPSALASAQGERKTAEAGSGGRMLEGGSLAIERRNGSISVDPTPACGDPAPDGAGGAAGTPTAKGVSEPEITSRGQAIERELENWTHSIAGTGRDERRGSMILLLHRDFTDYDALRRKLESVSGSLKIVLRPACHSRMAIEEARQALAAKAWHPRAKSVPMGWYFDVDFSGFSVSVDESAPEVASALQQRLGALVRTRLEKLGPHPNQSRAGRSQRAPNSKP